jgi:glycine/D-amino acid oxidase-like deaminating enzyme
MPQSARADVPFWDDLLPAAAPRLETKPPSRADVVVIGGGVVGMAAAYQLARRGLDVVGLEKSAIAGDQSGRNMGFVRRQRRTVSELPLMIAAHALWLDMERTLGTNIGWVQGGFLSLAADDSSTRAYEEWNKLGAEYGVVSHILSSPQIQELVPGLRAGGASGLYTPSDGYVNPARATLALAKEASRAGARLVAPCAATAIVSAGARVIGVETNRGHIQAGYVVCAAGRFSRRLLRSVGINLPQAWTSETVVATEPLKPLTQIGVRSDRLTFRQLPSGSCLLSPGSGLDVDLTATGLRSASAFWPIFLKRRDYFRVRIDAHTLDAVRPRDWRSSRNWQPQPNRSIALRSLSELVTLFPDLPAVSPARIWTGAIDITPDLVPVLEALDKPSGLILATGFSGHGFALGPIVGVIVADLITEEKGTPFNLEAMRLARLAQVPSTTGKATL